MILRRTGEPARPSGTFVTARRGVIEELLEFNRFSSDAIPCFRKISQHQCADAKNYDTDTLDSLQASAEANVV